MPDVVKDNRMDALSRLCNIQCLVVDVIKVEEGPD